MALINAKSIANKVNAAQAENVAIVKTVNIDLLQPSKQNFYTMSDIDALAASIEEFGQLEPIHISNDYEIISGHRRYTALKQIGAATANVIFVRFSNETDKMALIIEANRQRVKTIEEFQQEVAEMKTLVEERKKSDPTFKGTTLQIVADMLGKSLSTVKRADRKNKKGSHDPKQQNWDLVLKINTFSDSERMQIIDFVKSISLECNIKDNVANKTHKGGQTHL